MATKSYTIGEQSGSGKSWSYTVAKSSIDAWIDSANGIPANATINNVEFNFQITKSVTLTVGGDFTVKVAGNTIADGKVASTTSTYNKNIKNYFGSRYINGDIVFDFSCNQKATFYIKTFEIIIDYTEHTHNYTTETSRTPSTCCTKGSVTKKCSCGGTQTTELALDPNNHSGGTEVRNAVSATCTATGYTGDTYCKGCGVKLSSGTTIAKKAHTEVTIPAVAPTCTTTGLTEGKKCSVCGTIITAQQTVAALGHDYKSTVIAPTATSRGYTRHTCSRCGDYYDDSFTYFITFKNGDGTTLETVVVAQGNTPKCSKTPTKAETAEYSYTFNNTWQPALGAATANQVYTPNFTATKRSYRVRWFNEDGTLLETDTTLYGVMPTYDGATPTKAATAEFTYTFKGWHVEVKTVTGEFDYYARYTETTNKYKVTWKNDNGDVLEEDETEYGKIPTYDSAEPTKASTAEFTYTFAGWDTAISEVEGDIVYTATYTEHRRSYNLKVSYRESEGEVIGVANGSYEYDTPLVATANPKPGYKFLYWVLVSEDGTETTHTSNPLSFGIYCDTTIGAVFERIPIPFKVNLERVTGVYAVPSTKTIVYVISGTVPTVEMKADTVDEWHFLVSNTVPENSYPLEKVIVKGTRLY